MGLSVDWATYWSLAKQAKDPTPYYESLDSNNGKASDFAEWCESLHVKVLGEVLQNAPVEVLVLFIWRFDRATVGKIVTGYTVEQCRIIGAAWVNDRTARGLPTTEQKRLR